MGERHSFCSTSAVILMIFFWPLHLRPCIHSAVRAVSTHPPRFFALRKKSACSPSAVNDLFKTYCKTPVPLLVRFLPYVPSAVARNLLNLFKTKLKKHRFSEVKFQKVLLAAVPLTVLCVDIASFFAMCQKHKKNQCILHGFMCWTHRADDEIQNC